MNVSNNEIKEILNQYKKFCVYGLSPVESKPSHYVPIYMRDHDWDIVGTYPRLHHKNDFKIYNTLADVPLEYRRFVDVFRASDNIPELIDELLELGGVEVLWLQLGISHPKAEAKAEAHGIKVISDKCLIIEHRKYFTIP